MYDDNKYSNCYDNNCNNMCDNKKNPCKYE